MFLPDSFRVEDRTTTSEFVGRYSFATLVSIWEGAPFATHVPLLLDRAGDALLGHLARANPHWKAFADGARSLAIFSGPHAYISPSWYVSAPAVPTWNYAVVHIYGVPRLVEPDRTREIVDRTVRKFEDSRPAPWPNDMPEEFRQRLLAEVVGFEMPIDRIEGKFKLGQNRSAADQAGMLEGLRGDGTEANLLAEFAAQRQAAVQAAESGSAIDSVGEAPHEDRD